ncbi:MAG: lysine--tRNA ligase [Candidatus Micrarchaeota archaeon]
MHKHWSEQLADKVIAEKKEPYVVSSGMTTSGPAHFGTVCEFLFPYVIGKTIEKKGKKVKILMVGDILDAFDRIPAPMMKYEQQLTPHLGKPLCYVPDPTGKSKSFGEYFLDEVKELMKKLNVHMEVLTANELYESGKFDEWARFYLENETKAKEIIERTSGRKLPKDFSVLMPICEKCGKIATTRVTSHDNEGYEYVCDKDVEYTKGCGYRGKNKLTDHKYKIMWRLHWPAWKQILHSSIEGAGVDHHTKGGSEDTCCVITKELIQKDYHIPYKYGFILMEGKKYSKSKGLGMGVTELLTFIPPEILKYALLKPDLEENIDINPTAQNLLLLIDDFEKIASKELKEGEESSRADEKKKAAYELSASQRNWTAPFLDMILYYQIYGPEGASKVLEDKKGLLYMKPYVQKWIDADFVPEEYKFKYQPKKADGKVREFAESLKKEMDATAIHNAVFEFAKSNGMEPKDLFKMIYQCLIGKEKGPRLGKLIHAIGVERIKKDVL